MAKALWCAFRAAPKPAQVSTVGFLVISVWLLAHGIRVPFVYRHEIATRLAPEVQKSIKTITGRAEGPEVAEAISDLGVWGGMGADVREAVPSLIDRVASMGRERYAPVVDGLLPPVIGFTLAELAASSLGEIGDPRAVPVLVHALEGRDPDLQRAAVEALGAIADAAAVEGLKTALKNDELKRYAEEALEKTKRGVSHRDAGIREGILLGSATQIFFGTVLLAALTLAWLCRFRAQHREEGKTGAGTDHA